MRLNKFKCESCNNESEDWRKTKNWMHISERISIGTGEFHNSTSCIKYHHKGRDEGFDFCSIECFIKFIEDLKNE